LLLVAGVLLAACTAPRTPLQGYDSHPEASPAGVLLDGVLERSRESPCVLLKPLGEPPIGLVWPPGYSATLEPLRIYDETGMEVASEGMPVTLAGGIIAEPNAYCQTTMLFQVSGIMKGDVPNAR
jgi:hypothetical protein